MMSLRRLGLKAGLPLIALSVACSSKEGSTPSDATAARKSFLASVTDRVVLPVYAELESEASAMEAAASALAAETSTPTLQAARARFVTFSAALQAAEPLQFGPAGLEGDFAGGMGLRDEMYSWPLVNPCRIDQELVRNEFSEPGFFDARLVNIYGMDGLEYVLYREGVESSCASSHVIQTDGSWAALAGDPSALASRRAAYAAAVSARLAADAKHLHEAWQTGFGQQLKSAGDGSATYARAQQALDEVFAAIFYVEKAVKDTKLGTPLGITVECMQPVCPDLVESAHAHLSLEWIRANLETFAAVYHGGEASDAGAFGFDDLLRDAGAAQLADEMSAHLDEALAAAGGVPTPLYQHLDSPEAVSLHTELSDIATLLKTQFVSVLALRVPDEGAADND